MSLGLSLECTVPGKRFGTGSCTKTWVNSAGLCWEMAWEAPGSSLGQETCGGGALLL